MSPSGQITYDNNPAHIAIIMDGNGRWASKRGLPRTAGHQQGAEAVKKTVKSANEIGLGYLTLFGFSSENWQRPAEEVGELIRLLRIYLRSETAELHKNNVRLRVIGDRGAFDSDIVDMIEQAENLTSANSGLNLTIALNYGGRGELLNAAYRMAKDMHDQGICPERETVEARFERYLMTAGMPDPDLMIRTSGEKRISNFLLWQCAYAEFVFTDTLWPDFSGADLSAAIEEYCERERRFGRVKALGGGGSN